MLCEIFEKGPERALFLKKVPSGPFLLLMDIITTQPPTDDNFLQLDLFFLTFFISFAFMYFKSY